MCLSMHRARSFIKRLAPTTTRSDDIDRLLFTLLSVLQPPIRLVIRVPASASLQSNRATGKHPNNRCSSSGWTKVLYTSRSPRFLPGLRLVIVVRSSDRPRIFLRPSIFTPDAAPVLRRSGTGHSIVVRWRVAQWYFLRRCSRWQRRLRTWSLGPPERWRPWDQHGRRCRGGRCRSR